MLITLLTIIVGSPNPEIVTGGHQTSLVWLVDLTKIIKLYYYEYYIIMLCPVTGNRALHD